MGRPPDAPLKTCMIQAQQASEGPCNDLLTSLTLALPHSRMLTRMQVAVKIFSIDLADTSSSSTRSTPTAITTTSSSRCGSPAAPWAGGGGCGGSSGARSGGSDPLMRAFSKEVEVLSLVSEGSMYCCSLVGCMVRDRRPCIIMKWFGNGHLQVPVGEWLGPLLSLSLPVAATLVSVTGKDTPAGASSCYAKSLGDLT